VSLREQLSVWKSEFVIYVDSDTEELRFKTIEEALAVADELGVDCEVFVEETGKLPVKLCDVLAPAD
jgi:hypothetical protein